MRYQIVSSLLIDWWITYTNVLHPRELDIKSITTTYSLENCTIILSF